MKLSCICTGSALFAALLTTSALAGGSDCCIPNGSPGCDDAACQDLICSQDPFCCETEWDGICADAAVEQCEVCAGGPGNPACNADAGPCDVPNGTPGCDDVECCNIVCSSDPFCCDTEWDQACVDGAAALCGGGGVCGPGAGDCFIANGTPGCDDVKCCEAICAADPFCCDVEWDGICAAAAASSPACGFEPCDLTCPDGATDEGEDCGADTNGGCNATPNVFGAIACGETICGTAWAEGGTRDTDWFLVTTTAECTTLTATLTYEGNGVVFIVDGIGACAPVVIGVTGSSNNCEAGPPASADVPPGTYAVFVANAAFDGAPCGGAVDYFVTLECIEGCEPPGPICGEGAGDCFIANGTPGCDDVACCEAICAADPFCCDVEWDQICADAAAASPACGFVPCELTCPDGATDEGEDCGADTNGGCNATPNVFGSIACGETICGTAWADGGTRDTDWFLVTTTAECTTLTATLTYEGNGVVFIVDGIDACAPVVIGTTGSSSNCEAGPPASADVPPGTYAVFVANAAFDGAPCDGGAVDYFVTLECIEGCEPPGPICGEGAGPCGEPNGTPGCEDVVCCELVCAQDPFCCDVEWDQICADAAADLCDQGLPPCSCPGDLDGDGVVGAADLAILLAAWNTDGEGAPFCSPDFDNSGNVDAADLAVLLAAWGDCPAPANADACEDRVDIMLGSTDYSTLDATTDGLAHVGCQFDGQTYEDIWFNYTAMESGTLTVSTCDAADYDTDLVVYAGCDTADCPPGDDALLACSDDAVGCGGFTSELTVDVVAGECYKIRVGGWNPGDQGNGTLTLSLGGGGGGSDCCEPNGTPGCDDQACQDLICGQDPFCCDVEWDGICADAAIDQCGVCQ